MTREEFKKNVIIELARISFWQFCIYWDKDFFNARLFLKLIADAFQIGYDKYITGLNYKMGVSMPPRAGKSYISSLFCAWFLGKQPTESIMRNTCTARLYEKLSYDTRAIINSDKYRLIFPISTLAADKQSLAGWNLKQAKQVSYFGAGSGGTIIGFGASGIAMTDDLFKGMKDALSETTQENKIMWKESEHNSRLEGNVLQIDIGTRWTKKDIIGDCLERNEYDKYVIIKALDENEKSFCETVRSTEQYLQTRQKLIELGREEIWHAEFMQEPIEAKGLLFPDSSLMKYKLSELKNIQFIGRIGYIDVADKGTDDLCFLTGDIYSDGFVYINPMIVFTKDNTDITQPRCIKTIQELNHNYVRVESNNMGGIFSSNLRNVVGAKILPINNSTNKLTRILMEVGFIKEKMKFLDSSEYSVGSDYDRFYKQITSYLKTGENAHDDAPDATSGLSLMCQSFFPNYFRYKKVI